MNQEERYLVRLDQKCEILSNKFQIQMVLSL